MMASDWLKGKCKLLYFLICRQPSDKQYQKMSLNETDEDRNSEEETHTKREPLCISKVLLLPC